MFSEVPERYASHVSVYSTLQYLSKETTKDPIGNNRPADEYWIQRFLSDCTVACVNVKKGVNCCVDAFISFRVKHSPYGLR